MAALLLVEAPLERLDTLLGGAVVAFERGDDVGHRRLQLVFRLLDTRVRRDDLWHLVAELHRQLRVVIAQRREVRLDRLDGLVRHDRGQRVERLVLGLQRRYCW